MINNKKFYWIVIPLSIVLLGSLAMNVVAWKIVTSSQIFEGITEIANARFRADKLTRLRDHLNNGEIEEAQALTNGLYEIETSLLELMQDPDLYPESINRGAKITLAEIESNFNQSSKSNE